MNISILNNNKNNFINISFNKIDINKLETILSYLNIEKLSIFVDDFAKYTYYTTLDRKEFINEIVKMNDSLLIFDGVVIECKINNEIEMLKNHNILIDINRSESLTTIVINNNKYHLTNQKLKEWFAK